MKSIEEYLKQAKYLTVEEVENPKWKLEDLTKICPSLTPNNYLSYILFLELRPDLSDDEKDTVNKLIKIMIALEKRDIEKQYRHFETAQFN